MNSKAFGSQSSRSQWILGIQGNELVNMIETKPLCDSSSKLIDVNHGERMNTFSVGGQKSK